MNTYRTSEIANKTGIHPNTVRLYEKLNLITKPERLPNGYRVYTDLHLEQVRFIRMALKAEILQNGLRKQVIAIIKKASSLGFDSALLMNGAYLQQIHNEQKRSEEAIEITKKLLSGKTEEQENKVYTRKEAADYLNISMDSLRNWEMNGLLKVKRRLNGYRIYTGEDILRLKIIRSLRCANYSLSAILRMLDALSKSPMTDIRQVINTPAETEDIISVCDHLLTALSEAETLAKAMEVQLKKMKKLLSSNPTF
ncbi:MerR family transcriptional regulator [Clostridium boliviensis]|uniref:MerR family transcriptional regulator n=1 Tax=Clostridium boliviensis TaxID=318465 RepID=A0ABU4GPN1_9CLOT|nr:MerR family transcriptional regulator [Clostridium boliviensis]MDW2798945.1 MerR family transcriptional regulator [Clostridium boliviensis]